MTLLRSLLLFAVAGYVLWEGVGRFVEPVEVQSTGMLIVAVIGLAFGFSDPLYNQKLYSWIGFWVVPPATNDLVPVFPWFGVVLLGVLAMRLVRGSPLQARLAARTLELNGIGTVNRWRGHVNAARDAHARARTAAPGDPDGMLGLAATEVLDHDYGKAGALYSEAEIRWPADGEVKQAAYTFRRQTNPRLFVLYEDDLSFRTESGGIGLPLFAREDLEAEYQKETRFQYLTGAESYSRTDAKIKYTHFFGLNHTLEVDARAAEYEYPTPPAPLPPAFSTAIDTFQEYRVRYTFPLTPEQRIAIRYSIRPTTLLNTQEKFTAHKVEAELLSRWLPRFETVFGTGWLRDLDENAVSTGDLTSQGLLKIGFQYDITNRLDVSAKFITNPDLDSSVNSTTIVQAGYSLTGTFALLARGRFDDYKTGDDQSAAYVALRFTPGSHLWSEAGAKYVQRGPESGVYPLVSLVGKF